MTTRSRRRLAGTAAPVPSRCPARLEPRQQGRSDFVALGAAIGYPLVTAFAGASWRRAELAGLMPEATALLTLGLVLATRPRQWPSLIVLPLLTLALGAAMLWLLATR